MLERFLDKTEFESYEDFMENLVKDLNEKSGISILVKLGETSGIEVLLGWLNDPVLAKKSAAFNCLASVFSSTD